VNSQIFAARTVPVPPEGFGEAFWNCVWGVGPDLEVTLFDDHPVSAQDVQALTNYLGVLPDELKTFYEQCTPWSAQREGPEIWREHLVLMQQCAIRNNALAHDTRSDVEVVEELRAAPALWPVHVSQRANVAAFVDQRGRLGIVHANIGVNLGRPLALGLRNYVIKTVVGEIVWEQKNYSDYESVLDDEIVVAAGEWPDVDAPEHPMVRIYQRLKEFRIDS
jgi:hypothetical protein